MKKRNELDEDDLIDAIDKKRTIQSNPFKVSRSQLKRENEQADHRDHLASAKILAKKPIPQGDLEDRIIDIIERMMSGPKKLNSASKQQQHTSDKLFLSLIHI